MSTPQVPHPLLAFGSAGQLLLRTLAGGRLSPSYLLEGNDEDSLLEAGRAFAAAALTGSPPGVRREAAEARVRRGSHPDLTELTRDKATVISVTALESVLARIHATPLESERQVFLIHPAEAMEAEGVARYLKALEEPPARTFFVLLSTRPERLPETVLSRCRRVRIPPLAAGMIAETLASEGLAHAAAARLARACGGSLTRARRMLRAGLLEQLDALARAARGEHLLVQAAEQLVQALTRAASDEATDDERAVDTKREHLRQLLRDLLYALCCDAREAACGRETDWTGPRPVEEALDLVAALQRLEIAVVSNVTPQVVAIETARALGRP